MLMNGWSSWSMLRPHIMTALILQARVIHSNSSEWIQIRDSVQAIKETAEAEDNEIGLQTSEELLEALRLSRCMIIMGCVHSLLFSVL